MSSSIFRRLISPKIISPPRKFFSTVSRREKILRPSSPWLMLPPLFTGGRDMLYNFWSPSRREVVSFNNRGGKEEADLMRDVDTKLVGSSHGWLALFNSGGHRHPCLLNPVSGRRIGLPPLDGKPFLTEEGCSRPLKVILSCSPDEDECRALMILGSRDRAAVCCPGRSRHWTPLGQWNEDPFSISNYNGYRLYDDFVYSVARKKMYGFAHSCLSSQEELESWDIINKSNNNGFIEPRMERWNRFLSNSELSLLSNAYLVYAEQSDQMFLVRRFDDFIDREKVDVHVYRIVDDDRKLELCSSLDDLVMFVGINHSVAVTASQFPDLKPNSIYFSDALVAADEQSIQVFDYQSKTCSPLYYPKIQTPLPWFTPNYLD